MTCLSALWLVLGTLVALASLVPSAQGAVAALAASSYFADDVNAFMGATPDSSNTVYLGVGDFSGCGAISRAIVLGPQTFSLIGSGKGATRVNCQLSVGSSSMFSFLDGDTVSIQGVTFSSVNFNVPSTGGFLSVSGATVLLLDFALLYSTNPSTSEGTLVYGSGSSVTVTNSTFYGNEAVNSVVKVSNSGSLLVTASNFTRNIGGVNCLGAAILIREASGVINSTVFLENTAEEEAPAVFVYTAQAEVHSCYFFGNGAANAGVMMALDSDSTLLVTSSEFDSNFALSRGGAVTSYIYSLVTLVDCTFVNHETTESGGTLRVNEAYMHLLNCTVMESSSTSGGVVSIILPVSVFMAVDCHFEGNTASLSGGAVFSDQGAVELVRSYFTENLSTSVSTGGGGAVYIACISPQCTAAIDDCIFHDNSAVYDVGGLVATGAYSLTLTASTFSSNKCDSPDWGDSAFGIGFGTIVTISDCAFVNNYGGLSAVFIGSACVVNMTDSIVADNQIIGLGAIHVLGVMEFHNVDITGNNATVVTSFQPHAAALYINSGLVLVKNCLVTNNYSPAAHGGFVFVDATVDVVSTAIEDNRGAWGSGIKVVRGNVDLDDVSLKGKGGVEIVQNGAMTFKNVDCSDSENFQCIFLMSGTYTFDGCHFFNNPGVALQAMSADTIISINNSVFSDNNGVGALKAYGIQSLSVVNTVFLDNVGGVSPAVELEDVTLANFVGVTSTGDSSNSESGGFMHFENSTVAVVNGTIRRASANNGGAFVCGPLGSLSLQSSTVSNCEGEDSGGVFALTSGCTQVTGIKSIFHGNQAVDGSVLADLAIGTQPTVLFSDCQFSLNVADDAIISGVESTITVQDSMFLENTATIGGIAMVSGNVTVTNTLFYRSAVNEASVASSPSLLSIGDGVSLQFHDCVVQNTSGISVVSFTGETAAVEWTGNRVLCSMMTSIFECPSASTPSSVDFSQYEDTELCLSTLPSRLLCEYCEFNLNDPCNVTSEPCESSECPVIDIESPSSPMTVYSSDPLSTLTVTSSSVDPDEIDDNDLTGADGTLGGLSLGAIIGIAVGGCCCIVAVIAAAVFFVRSSPKDSGGERERAASSFSSAAAPVGPASSAPLSSGGGGGGGGEATVVLRPKAGSVLGPSPGSFSSGFVSSSSPSAGSPSGSSPMAAVAGTGGGAGAGAAGGGGPGAATRASASSSSGKPPVKTGYTTNIVSGRSNSLDPSSSGFTTNIVGPSRSLDSNNGSSVAAALSIPPPPPPASGGASWGGGAASFYDSGLDSFEPAVATLDSQREFAGMTSPVVLGRGGQAVVYSAFSFALGYQVCLKVFNEASSYNREYSVLSAVPPHPNVVALLSISNLPPNTMAMKLAPMGNLAEHLAKTKLAREEVITVALGLATGLQHLHSVGVCHLDIKPANTLLATDNRGQLSPIITDFGASFVQGRADLRVDMCTVKYAAPEVLAMIGGKTIVEAKLTSYTGLDVYAFGVTVWEMMTGLSPHGDTAPAALVKAAMAQPLEFRVNVNLITENDIRAMVDLCTRVATTRVPQFDEIIVDLSDMAGSVKERSGSVRR